MDFAPVRPYSWALLGIFELASLAICTPVVAAIVSDGRSNWYEGASS